MKKEGLRVGIYARVSSDQQAEAGTISSQIAALKERVEKDGLQLSQENCFLDEGYTGSTFVRPGLERLRDVAACGVLDRLYVHTPDRLARNYAYQVVLVDEFKRCSMELVFLNSGLGQTPEEKMLIQVQGMVAEYERAKIMERTRRGRLHAARSGRVSVLTNAPYGYRYVRNQETREARYEINFEEARWVKKIFQWVGTEGASLYQVSGKLKQEGIKTRRNNAIWKLGTIHHVLRNPAYKGLAGYGKTQNIEKLAVLRTARGRPEQPRSNYTRRQVEQQHWISIPVPALVNAELFDAVQKQMEENSKRARQRRSGARSLLQGLLVCGSCGYAYCTLQSKTARYRYYRCNGGAAERFGEARICKNKSIHADPLEEAVWQDVSALLQDPQRIEKEYRRRLEQPKRGVETEQLKSVTSKVKRAISRLIDAYGDGLLEKHEFELRIKAAREKLEKLEVETKRQETYEVQQRDLSLIIGRLKEFTEKVHNGLQSCTWEMRRGIICALVKRIEVHEEKTRVVYRIGEISLAAQPEQQPNLSYLRNRANG